MSSSSSFGPAPALAPGRPSFDPQAFREACSLFASGVAIATVLAQDGTPHGLTISSCNAISMNPPLILICIDLQCPFLSYFRQGTHFAVNILSEQQRGLSVTFAEKPEGRFEGLDWMPGQTGAPLLRGSLAALECRTASIMETGDHAMFIGQVERAGFATGDPLLYFHREYRGLR